MYSLNFNHSKKIARKCLGMLEAALEDASIAG